jgi:pimeloyl-ACP methyl ester carboxylesterase
VPAVSGSGTQFAGIDAAFRTLPERYLGAEQGFDRTFHIRLRDLGRTWEVHATAGACRVRKGHTRREPDVTIVTDAETWQALREGLLLGVQAYRERRLAVRGNLDCAVAFEGLFRLPNGRPPLQQVKDVRVGRDRISVLSMGQGTPVLLLHGLGATKASFFDTAAALSDRYTVHALDLPGFGSSSKPVRGAYDAKWFAERVRGAMDELGVERAHIVGNSMGGRVAIELGLRCPERVGGLGLLCPGVAWVKRSLHPIVRLLRPEFGFLPHSFGRETIEAQFWSLFADRDRVDPSVADVVVGEFQRIYGSAGARHAFLASARNIYLERPFGDGGFYPRLAELERPALFVWGTHDTLIPAGFARHVRKWLPSAEQIVLDDCGHVPQVERPEQTNGMLMRFFARVDALGAAPVRSRVARAA